MRLPLPGPRRRLRAWRRTRPFGGGLLLVSGGIELLLVPLSPLTVLVGLGLGGVAAIGIGAALVVAGLFLWLLPQARAYVPIHALLLSVLSFRRRTWAGSWWGCCSASRAARRPSAGPRCRRRRRSQRSPRTGRGRRIDGPRKVLALRMAAA
ncbi:DUF6114 domain-containing protein [Streptomyces sp. NBC_00424]|uniref:DUF6114 domain-containing protein n=1 Tax=Streptomyces sp. NBC_00424 TaxID=2903648 RepID=UPI002B1D3E22|nr:DUF6114 domain-containing protein [Streptomyces sp. NBC_00424]